MQLSDVKKEKDEIKRARLLKQYCHSSNLNHDGLKRYLEREFKITKSNQWRLSCKKWLLWLANHQEIQRQSFDKDKFLESLADNLPIERKVQIVNQGIKHIGAEDEDVMLFFEFNLGTDDPRERVLYRKVLTYFEKKGFWQPRYKDELPTNQSITFEAFVGSPREARLHWLDSATNNPMQKKDISEWGMTALTFEPDSFIVSKLVKVLAEIFTATKLYYGRLVDILLIYSKDKDSRVRSNTLEALAIIMRKKVAVKRIENRMLEAMNDKDQRVKTTAFLQMFHLQPDETLKKIEGVVGDTQNKDDLESLRWLIEKALDLDKRFQAILELCDKRLQEIAIFFPDDELDWIR